MFENEKTNFELITPKKIKLIRASYGLSQSQFAELIGISKRTLQNWEIGHRFPCGPSCALLDVAETHPKIFLQKRSQRTNSKKLAIYLLKMM